MAGEATAHPGTCCGYWACGWVLEPSQSNRLSHQRHVPWLPCPFVAMGWWCQLPWVRAVIDCICLWFGSSSWPWSQEQHRSVLANLYSSRRTLAVYIKILKHHIQNFVFNAWYLSKKYYAVSIYRSLEALPVQLRKSLQASSQPVRSCKKYLVFV